MITARAWGLPLFAALMFTTPAVAGGTVDACGDIALRREADALELVPRLAATRPSFLVTRADESEMVADYVAGQFHLLSREQKDPEVTTPVVHLFPGDTVDDLAEPAPGSYCRVRIDGRHGEKAVVYTGRFSRGSPVSSRAISVRR